MSGRTFPHPRPIRRLRPLTSSSRCGCLAPNPFGSRPSARTFSIASVSRATARLGGGRLGRHLIVERCGSYAPPVKERPTRRCNAERLLRVDLAARAREAQCFVCTNAPFSRVHILSDALCTDPASLPPRRDLLGLGPYPVRSSTWQWTAFPRDPTGALRARRHSCSDPGELGHLPAGHYSLGRPPPWRGTSGRAWERPGGDPGPFDRCLLLTDVVFKDDRLTSRHTSHRHVPTRCEGLRFHAAMPTSANRRTAPGCCLPQPPHPSAYL